MCAITIANKLISIDSALYIGRGNNNKSLELLLTYLRLIVSNDDIVDVNYSLPSGAVGGPQLLSFSKSRLYAYPPPHFSRFVRLLLLFNPSAPQT